MPALFQPTGAQILSVLPTSLGAFPSAGLVTAAIIDADVITNGGGSIPAIQFERAKALLSTIGLDYTNLELVKWNQANHALWLTCFTEYLRIDRLKRLNALQKCEPDEEFQEKMKSFYRQVCEAWRALGITDSYYCSTGFESSPLTILEGKVRETPQDLIILN